MATSKDKLLEPPKVFGSTATSKVYLPAPRSQKVVWRIENYSKLNNQNLHSDTFSFGSRNWRMLLVNTIYTEIHGPRLEIYLCPVDHTDCYFNYTLAVIDQKNDLRTMKTEVKRGFNPSWSGYRQGLSLRLGEYYSPDNGYLLDDTCIVEVEISKARSTSKVKDVLFITLAFLSYLISCVSCVALVPFDRSSYLYAAMIWIANCSVVYHLLPFLLYDFLQKKSSASLPAKVIELEVYDAVQPISVEDVV